MDFYSNHWGRVTHVPLFWVIIGSGNVACLAPSHYLNQCWLIINWTLNWNSSIFCKGNSFQNAVCKMAAILLWPWCVNSLKPGETYMLHWMGQSLVQVMCYAINWTKADLLWFPPLGTNFNEILNMQKCFLKKIFLKILSTTFYACCQVINVLNMVVGPSEQNLWKSIQKTCLRSILRNDIAPVNVT